MKEIRKIVRKILLFTMAFVILMCTGCSKEQKTSGEDGATTTWEDEEVQYRVCITSDVHYTPLNDGFGWNYEERVQLWVDTILEEHEKEPFDLIIINGDVSLDWRANGGTVLKQGTSTTAEFIEKYVSQLPEGVPVYILPGNHERYTEELWQQLTGNGRSASFVLGDNLFIMPDSFRGDTDMTIDATGESVALDTDYIKAEMEKYPKHNVYIISHEIDTEKQPGAFWRICLKENVRGMFAGHTHAHNLIFPELASGKVIAQTGCFAWDNTFGAMSTTGTWGVRDLIITENHAVSRYIVIDQALVVDGTPKHYPAEIDSVVEYY